MLGPFRCNIPYHMWQYLIIKTCNLLKSRSFVGKANINVTDKWCIDSSSQPRLIKISSVCYQLLWLGVERSFPPYFRLYVLQQQANMAWSGDLDHTFVNRHLKQYVCVCLLCMSPIWRDIHFDWKLSVTLWERGLCTESMSMFPFWMFQLSHSQ